MKLTPHQSSRLTPPNRHYETCDYTYAELRIYPDSQSADEITGILGISPTQSQDKGSLLVKNERTRKIPRTGWFLSSEGRVDSRDVRDHLNWLIDTLVPVADELRLLQAQDGMKMTISCTWWSATGHGGPVLWPEQMKALAELNLECSFDVYFSDSE